MIHFSKGAASCRAGEDQFKKPSPLRTHAGSSHGRAESNHGGRRDSRDLGEIDTWEGGEASESGELPPSRGGSGPMPRHFLGRPHSNDVDHESLHEVQVIFPFTVSLRMCTGPVNASKLL